MREVDLYDEPCEHCALLLSAADCGVAAVQARWRDEDGYLHDEVYRICRECLSAGHRSGPGYVEVEVDHAQ